MKTVKFGLIVVPVALTIAAIPAIAQQQTYTYECDTGQSFTAQYGSNSATVQIDNQTLTLPAVSAVAPDDALAPGQARYSDGRYLLFTSSNNTEAFVEVDGDKTHEGCIAQTTRPSSTSSSSSSTPVRALW